MANENLSNLALSDNGFLFDTTTGFTYTLNKLGTGVLKGLIDGKDIGDITETILDEYDVEFDILQRDVEQFLSHLKELGLLVKENAQTQNAEDEV